MRRLASVVIFACLVLAPSVPAAAVGQPSGARPGVVRSTTWLLRNSLSGGAAEVQFDFGLPGDQKLMGDWNGDGIETVGFHRGAYWHLRNANGPGASNLIVRFGDLPGDVPVVGDWNGDGVDTIGFFRAGAWHLRDSISGGTPDRLFSYGRQPGDVPVVWKPARIPPTTPRLTPTRYPP